MQLVLLVNRITYFVCCSYCFLCAKYGENVGGDLIGLAFRGLCPRNESIYPIPTTPTRTTHTPIVRATGLIICMRSEGASGSAIPVRWAVPRPLQWVGQGRASALGADEQCSLNKEKANDGHPERKGKPIAKALEPNSLFAMAAQHHPDLRHCQSSDEWANQQADAMKSGNGE